MAKNYYHILGLSPTASGADIKAAYKRLALKFHPDKNPGNARAEDQFKQVNEAYQVLSNPRRRATYDLQRQQALRQNQPPAYAEPRYHHTRPPAGFQERHYRQRPQKPAQFSPRDIQIVAGVLLLLLVLALGINLVRSRLALGQALEQAREAEGQQQWVRAQEAYTKVLGLEPELQEARLQRAAIRQQQLNDAQGAAADYSVVLHQNESPKAAWYAARGECYLTLRDLPRALRDFNSALKLNPALQEVYKERGVVHLQLETNWPAAIADFSHYLNTGAAAAEDKTEAYLYRAFAYFRADQLDSAWQDTGLALALDSINARTYYLQAIVRRAQKKKRSSCALLRKAVGYGFTEVSDEMKAYCAQSGR